MASNQAKIVLTNPCSENWNSMQVDTGGRFCQSCQKSVIDFTSKSDHEIKEFLKDKQGEKLCGRFYVQQLERIRIEIDPNLLVSNIPFWQKFLVVILVCFGADFLGCNFVFAQTQTDSIDSIPVRTELVDSLDRITLLETDSIVELTVDSLQKPFQIQEIKIESVVLPYIYPIVVMGNFMPTDPKYYPTWKIPLTFDDIASEDDTINTKTGIAHAENIPVLPKRRRRKPALPENAIIADSGDRRKTRRS